MAHAPAALVIIAYRDASDSIGYTRLWLATGSVDAARAAVATRIGVMGALSGCAVTGYSITWSTHLSDTPAPGPQLVSTAGIFIWQTAVADAYAVTYIPGINAAMLDATDPAGLAINTQKLEVINYIAVLRDGAFVNPFEYDITALENAFVQFEP